MGRTIEELVGHLSLEQKVQLLTGQTAWRTWPLPEIGLRNLVFSDGPVGVRGTGETSGEVSACLPSATALAATWDVALARRTGEWLAGEARMHGVDVVLAPVVNIQRTPIGGRHFESLSEDPQLTGDIAAALIEGCQAWGVAACVKHYVGNEVETLRTRYVSRIGDQALREVYLAPFERAVRAGVWSVMAAYNRVEAGGETARMVSHYHLLVDVLKGEWGFAGPVVSDWTAVDDTVGPALGGTDLAMPGPRSAWSDGALLDAVRRGEVSTTDIDDKVRRLLWLARHVGALDGELLPAPPADDGLPRELAAQACVVLANCDDVLPLANPTDVVSIALIGPNAMETRLLGGGSCSVDIAHSVGLADGLRRACPNTRVDLWPGVSSRVTPPLLDVARTEGIHVEDLTGDARVISASDVLTWDGVFDGDIPPEATDIHVVTDVCLTEPGVHWLGVGTVGRHRIVVDGQLVDETREPADDEIMIDSSFNVPPTWGSEVTITTPRRVRVEAWVQVIPTQWGPRARAALHHQLPGPTPDEMIAQAAAAAEDAELAIVVVGTNEETESEGWDREDLRLPGRQDELVSAVLDSRPDAIIVVNAGAPVLLPWLERARTVLWFWFPGQDAGAALADILLGVREPAGRLPWSLPDAQEHCPVPSGLPDEQGYVTYGDGVHVGYRGWAKSAYKPVRPFGFGLGWTTWDIVDATINTHTHDGVELTVTVRNTGPRTGSDVVQAYLRPPEDSKFDRPVLWLAGHCRIQASSGETVQAGLVVPRRAFEVWDPGSRRWVLPVGDYRLAIGHNAQEQPLQVVVTWA